MADIKMTMGLFLFHIYSPGNFFQDFIVDGAGWGGGGKCIMLRKQSASSHLAPGLLPFYLSSD